MDGFLINNLAKKDMLNQEIKISFIFLFILYISMGCEIKNRSSESKIIQKSKETISISVYHEIYNKINDTLKFWCINNLPNVTGESKWGFCLDSVICFNSNKDRLISTILLPCKDSKCVQDEIKYLYGEKINEMWFFFRGPSITIAREINKDHDIHQPFSCEQLHQIALKEVYVGYLKSNGEINENWFTSLFEGAGWANWDDSPKKIKNYTRKDYEQLHLKKVRGNWSRANKDSIKQLPINKNNLP